MFSTGRPKQSESFSKHRAGKSQASKSKRSSSFRERSFNKRPGDLDLSQARQVPSANAGPSAAQLNSGVVTLAVGQPSPRLFAAHIDVLRGSSHLQSALHSHFYNPRTQQLTLPTEIPEVFSCVLEFLYKGDYTPKLVNNATGSSKHSKADWTLEPTAFANTVWMPSSQAPTSPTTASPHPSGKHAGVGVNILKDTAVYCAAERFGLPALKRLALRKQGLQSGVPVVTILASARFAYANTPESDRHLRAHFLALIIRSRNTFRRSGTMQAEMSMASPRLGGPENDPSGGTALWFDLFVAMCNHLDDMEGMVKSPR